MGIEHFRAKSAEEMVELRAKAVEARHKKTAWAEANLKLDWADASHWRELASKHSYKLPMRNEKAASKWVNRFLKAKGLSSEWYQEVTGYSNGNVEARANPKMPAFSQVGLLLEAYDEMEGC